MIMPNVIFKYKLTGEKVRTLFYYDTMLNGSFWQCESSDGKRIKCREEDLEECQQTDYCNNEQYRNI